MMLAFNRVFFMFLVMFLLCLPLALLLRRGKGPAEGPGVIAE
jgi:hypothetical protein